MKRSLVLALALVFSISTVATMGAQSTQDPAKQDPSKSQPSTQDPSKSQPMKSLRGTVSSVDNTAKSFVVKDSSGKEVTVFWTDSTRMSGDLKEGASVNIQTSDQGGKTVATSVEVQAAKKAY
jgi:Cu/Ag efflux protein CusF